MNQRLKAELFLVTTTFIWGATFVVVKEALADASPFAFIAVRFSLAGLLMFAVMARGRMPHQVILPSTVLGVFLFTGYAFQTVGLVFTTPAKSAFITGFSVILVPLFSLFSGYRMSIANAAGALLGLLGLYFLVVPSRLESVNRGDLLTLFGAIAFAVHIVLVGKYTRRFSFLHLAPGQILFVGIVADLMVVSGAGGTLHWTGRLAFAIVVTAIFATGIAFSMQVWAQQYTPPAPTALIFALEPVFAALVSRIFLHERLGGMVLLGSALILAGMVVSEIWSRSAPSPIEG
jgi:drug/metabolite transporter (DMT)-like permease